MPSSLWHKKKQRKRSTALLLKKGGFVSVSLIGIWELSYATPSSLWKLCGDERNPQPPLSLKRTVCISLPCSICEPCSKCRTPSLWHKKKQRKKSTALLLKKEDLYLSTWLGCGNYHTLCLQVCGSFAVTNGKTCGSIIVVVRKSNQCEIEPQGNWLPCGSLRLGRIET